MLYNLLYPLSSGEYLSALNLFKYITFRTIGGVLTALVISFLVGPWLIRRLQARQELGQPIRSDGPERHLLEKKGTPTMGGTLILLAVAIPTLLWADLTNPYIWIVLLTTLGFGMIGYFDDMQKLIHKNPKGVPARTRIMWQIGISLAAALALKLVDPVTFGHLSVPFFKISIWIWGGCSTPSWSW